MSANVTLRAAVKMPIMPNFLEIEGVHPASLDEAIAKGSGNMRVDVAALDDQALEDFCQAWQLAFVRHAKARREARKAS